MRYRAETASGGTGADVVDTEAKPLREVIAHCDTLSYARRIAVALNANGAADPEIYVARLERAVLDMGQEIGRLRSAARRRDE